MAESRNEDGILCQAPRDIGILEFAQARIREMEAMEKASWGQGGNNLAQQRLPRHMRRRAASHNAKRLPRRLREQAKKEMLKAGPPSSNKRPSRKHRRRPSNLLQEYNRRQRRNVWLETHIWHAKRFHMLQEWGYKIPLHPNDKGVRAAHRAMVSHCLIQDLSYFCCIELKGPEKDITSALSQLTDPQCGLSVGAEMYLTGRREGSIMLYQKGGYPYGAICDINFLWKPVDPLCEGQTGSARQLWLWCHPAAYTAVLDALAESLGIVAGGDSDVEMAEGDKVEDPQCSSSLAEGTSKTKEAEDKNILQRANFFNGSVTVTSLKDTLVRFRLSGPQSQQILNDTLKPAKIPQDSPSEGSDTRDWFSQYLAGDKSRQCVHTTQEDLWKKLRSVQSPGELEPRCVLGLTVRDPRIHLPVKRTPVQPDLGITAADVQASSDVVRQLPESCCGSPLWESTVREEVKASQISVQEINRHRQNMLVPGTALTSLPNENCVPVILIQRPGTMECTRTRETPGQFGCGWDLLLPGGWAMAFWVPLVYRGARAGALKEIRHSSVETNKLLYPDHFPDTPAGSALEETKCMELQQKHNKIPPAKRPNYMKLGICSPFDFPWNDLVAEWIKDWKSTVPLQLQCTGKKFYVLRNRKLLKLLQNLCSSYTMPDKVTETPLAAKIRKRDTDQCVHDNEGKEGDISDSVISQIDCLIDDWGCLVPVSVIMVDRGTPEAHSLICLPSPTDQLAIHTTANWVGPTETLHPDPAQADRRRGKGGKAVDLDPLPTGRSVKNSCEREVMGFVKDGSFSLSRGKGHGIGFVTLPALVTQIQKTSQGRIMVLIRSKTSLQYRLGHLVVI